MVKSLPSLFYEFYLHFNKQVAVLRRSTNKLVHKIFRTTDGDIKLTVPKTKIHLSIQKSTTPTSTAKNKKTVSLISIII